MSDDGFRHEYGAAWLDLIATVTGRRRPPYVDRLDAPCRLGEFLAAVECAPRRSPDAADLDAAIRLRDALYPLARAAADDAPPDPEAVRVVNASLAADVAPSLRSSGDGLVLTRPRDTSAALARIARQAVDTLAGPGRPRLRACGDDTCAGIFIDDTGRRRWCSDSRCGSRSRVRAHRARLSGAADK